MADSFETVLAGILNQKSDLESSPERAIEIFVVLPLLSSVGWNTGNASEVYPQHVLPEGGIVDYYLKIDGISQMVIEVKRWGHVLNNEDEAQLANYCRVAEPKIALLTSGRAWRLYLPPTKRSPLREFLELDITDVESTEMERTFRQFLSRESMVNSRTTLSTARKLHRERQAYQKFRRDVTAAWNELVNDEDELVELTMEFSEKRGIPVSRENIQRFLGSLHGPLVNEVPTKPCSFRKPSSYVLPSSPTGNSGNRKVKGPKGWNSFLAELCTLMYERHAESFRQNILPIGLFSEAEDSTFSKPIDNSGIFARNSNSSEKIREACYEVVASFGYPKDSLVIKDSKGAVL